jgi:hypothetical protein
MTPMNAAYHLAPFSGPSARRAYAGIRKPQTRPELASVSPPVSQEAIGTKMLPEVTRATT